MKKNLFSLTLLFVFILAGIAAQSVSAQFPRTRRFSADINGASISYTVTGIRGETIVLIHGYPLNGDLFERQRRVLGFNNRIITIDLRGFGYSTIPNDQASIDLYVDDVSALLTRLGIQRAIIGGHSMGGAVTLRFYEREPQRFRGMILNDAVFMPPPTIEQFMWRGYQQQLREMGVASIVPLLLPEFVTGRNRTDRPELATEITREILMASVNGAIGGARALETRPDLRPILPAIAVPTLILFGEEDSLTPMETARMLNQTIPFSDLSIIRGATHGVIREESDQANAVIQDWLTRNFGSGSNQKIAAPVDVKEQSPTSNE